MAKIIVEHDGGWWWSLSSSSSSSFFRGWMYHVCPSQVQPAPSNSGLLLCLERLSKNLSNGKWWEFRRRLCSGRVMCYFFNCVVPDLGNIILQCLVAKDVQPELCAAQCGLQGMIIYGFGLVIGWALAAYHIKVYNIHTIYVWYSGVYID